MAVQRLPYIAMLRPIPPVVVDRGSRALALAHEKEPASLASPVLLRGVVEREVALEALRVGLGEVDAILVRPAAVAALAVPFHPLDRARCVGIAGVPDTRGALVGAE